MIWSWNLDTDTPHSQRGGDGCCMGRLALSWHPIFPHAGLGGFDKPCHHRQHRHLGREWWQWQWLPLVQQGMSSVWWSAHGGKIWMKKTADKALIKKPPNCFCGTRRRCTENLSGWYLTNDYSLFQLCCTWRRTTWPSWTRTPSGGWGSWGGFTSMTTRSDRWVNDDDGVNDESVKQHIWKWNVIPRGGLKSKKESKQSLLATGGSTNFPGNGKDWRHPLTWEQVTWFLFPVL